MAVELGVGYRNADWDQLDLQWDFEVHAVLGRTPCDFRNNVVASRTFYDLFTTAPGSTVRRGGGLGRRANS